jgi:hypothetical protein
MIERFIEPISNILDKFIADKDLKERLRFELDAEIHRIAAMQLEVNKQEASHKSLFVAGWRPFVGWTCGFALCYHFILAPLLAFAFSFYYPNVSLPEFDFTQLSTILMGMLGLGSLRTFEKIKNVARDK